MRGCVREWLCSTQLSDEYFGTKLESNLVQVYHSVNLKLEMGVDISTYRARTGSFSARFFVCLQDGGW